MRKSLFMFTVCLLQSHKLSRLENAGRLIAVRSHRRKPCARSVLSELSVRRLFASGGLFACWVLGKCNSWEKSLHPISSADLGWNVVGTQVT